MKLDVQGQLWRLRRIWRHQKIRRVIQEKGFWFVDIPRTGSTSVKSQLAEAAGATFGKSSPSTLTLPDHTSAQQVRTILGPEIWNSVSKFTFVRNPWDRFLSLYRFRCKYGNLRSIAPSFEEYVLALQNPTFSYRRKESPFWHEVYYWNQCDFICDQEGQIMVEQVYRFEEREAALKEISELTNTQLSSQVALLPTKSSADYRSFYSNKSRAVIESYCQDDIVNFDYRF